MNERATKSVNGGSSRLRGGGANMFFVLLHPLRKVLRKCSTFVQTWGSSFNFNLKHIGCPINWWTSLVITPSRLFSQVMLVTSDCLHLVCKSFKASVYITYSHNSYSKHVLGVGIFWTRNNKITRQLSLLPLSHNYSGQTVMGVQGVWTKDGLWIFVNSYLIPKKST